MPSQLLPDPMPLREALRGLRHLLRKGGETLRDTVAVESLPEPAAQLAGLALRGASSLAKEVDDAASGLAKRLLGGAPAETTLRDISAGAAPEAAFASAYYAASHAVLQQLGAAGLFISEAAARRAFGRTPSIAPDTAYAAQLTEALLTAKTIKGHPEQPTPLPREALELITVFAVMLWLLSPPRPEREDEAALKAATELALALRADLAKAGPQGVEPLYREFASHV